MAEKKGVVALGEGGYTAISSFFGGVGSEGETLGRRMRSGRGALVCSSLRDLAGKELAVYEVRELKALFMQIEDEAS